MVRALMEGNGSQAQFSHPDLGGMGQWSQGGMIMVGDMFNEGLNTASIRFVTNSPASCAISNY